LIKWICVEKDSSNCPLSGDPGVYYVSNADFVADKDLSLGISYGVLTVPYKYHFSDHALTGGSTVGGYLGLTQNWGFTQVSEVVGAGLALVSTTAATSNFTSGTAGGTTSGIATAHSSAASTPNSSTAGTTSTLTGLTLAAGLLGKIGNTNTQFGLLAGVDVVAKSDNYQYSGKPWLSLSIGYSFSN